MLQPTACVSPSACVTFCALTRVFLPEYYCKCTRTCRCFQTFGLCIEGIGASPSSPSPKNKLHVATLHSTLHDLNKHNMSYGQYF